MLLVAGYQQNIRSVTILSSKVLLAYYGSDTREGDHAKGYSTEVATVYMVLNTHTNKITQQ